ncbi:MAG: hypothetical protein HOL15_10165 [Nitrospinaceae bacterium]|nr:hypothetical protein [Nitrospinaceae bacterium]
MKVLTNKVLSIAMEFIKKNIVIILSLALSYAIIYSTADTLPGVIHSLSGVFVEEDFFYKYRFPVAILALLIFPIIRGLKNKLDL